MKQETPRNLIDTYLLGRATDKEKDVLESWYLQYTDQQIDKLPEPNYLDIEQEVWSKIEEQTPGYEPRLSSLKLQAPEVQKKSISFFLMLGSVAALIFFILGVGLFYRYLPFNPFFQNTYKSTEINNIKPAKRTATLTLANGRMIKLNDSKDGVIIVAGKLTYADGSEIVLNDENDTAKVITWAENNINISTPRGGTYNLKLPDGSNVWLNSASSIQFPASFDHAKQRKVELTGEAYFEIKKSPNIPFIVKSGGQQATVLGTEFNINSYADESNITTTLVNGSLRVSSETGKSILLVPGRQTLFRRNSFEEHVANVEMELAWRNGSFYFNKTSFDAMMRQISRWYNVDVVYVKNKIPDIKFTGEIKRDVMLQTLLTYVEDLGVKIRLDGRIVYID